MRLQHRLIASAATAVALAALTLGGCASMGGGGGGGMAQDSAVPNPKVTGPIAVRATPGDKSHDYPWMSTIHPIAENGYVEEEFFYEGTARQFNTTGDNAMAGKETSSGHPYKTRMLVRRPKDMSKFNGVVLAEWQNVTASFDLDAMWGGSYEHIMREGYVWVGISAQFVGVNGEPNGNKVWSPIRYGTLDVTANGTVPRDSLSYDIFAQGMEAIRTSADVKILGGAYPKTVIAMGASQSAGRLGTYINALNPQLGGPVDAYYVMIGGAKIREDLDKPTFKLLSETDIGGQVRSRQPDTDKFRLWEVPGASHSSRRTSMNSGPLTKRDHVTRSAADCEFPTYPRIPMNYVLGRSYDHIKAWVEDGKAPPTVAKVEVEGAAIKRDADGNAIAGGIRLGEFDPAIALNNSVNRARPGGAGGQFCNLYGQFKPFDDAKLAAMYPTHDSYVTKVKATNARNRAAGYIDAQAEKQSNIRAEQSIVGLGLKCGDACHGAQDLLDTAYYYLGASSEFDRLTTSLAAIVRTIAEGKNDKAKADLAAFNADLKNLETKGKLNWVTVGEMTNAANGVAAKIK